MSDQDIYFSRISKTELSQSIEHVISNGMPISIWHKGSRYHEDFIAKRYESEGMELEFIKDDDETSFDDEDVIINFAIKGVHFFGTARVLTCGLPSCGVLILKEEFFKHERRFSFRLQTALYDKLECAASVSLALANAKIHDVSVGGMAIVVEAGMKEYFIPGRITRDVQVVLDGTKLVIPKMQIVYTELCLFAQEPSGKEEELEKIKVGFQFIDLPQQIEDQLSQFINKYIKRHDIREAFQKFLSL